MPGLDFFSGIMVGLPIAVPLAGLWAFPQRRWVWMYPLIGLPIVADLLKDLGDDVEPIHIALSAVPRALAVLVPVAMLVGYHWAAVRRNFLFWFLVLVAFGLVARLIIAVIAGEAWQNKDSIYCWDEAQMADPDCRLNPWLLGSAGIGYGGLVVYIYGTIPVMAVLAFAGWRRRRRAT